MSRPNRVLAVVVGGVVVLAVVAAIVAARRPPPTLDLDTPEGVVQAFLQAVLEDESDTAAALMSPSSGCDSGDVTAAFHPDSARIVLLDSAVDGDTATVSVEVIESTGSGLFDGSEFSHDQSFTLAHEDGSWLVTGEPWPLYFCDRG